MTKKTLLFCTIYAGDDITWDKRYRRWLDYIRASGIAYDSLVIVDDGSPVLPDWTDLPIYLIDAIPATPVKESIHHFVERLGLLEDDLSQPFPGWYRSFSHAVKYAVARDFDRILHIESDAYLISGRAVAFFNELDVGWAAPWCPLHGWPESTLQIINSDQIGAALQFFGRSYAEHGQSAIQPIEMALPLTFINRDLVGDRYGEIGPTIPFGADFASQIHWNEEDIYFWWCRRASPSDAVSMSAPIELEEYYATLPKTPGHSGVDYQEFLAFLNYNLAPVGFLEIGTHEGEAVSQFTCDALCVEPNFTLSGNVVGRRERTFLFQMTSDRFFAECDPGKHIKLLDVAFLDGVHLHESLLRDFMNVERHAHPRSIIILHDCFPLNSRMAARDYSTGSDSEAADTRDFWTGDVWKTLLILRASRPDLQIFGVDCPPTGLVLIRNLDSDSRILHEKYQSIIDEIADLSLERFGLEALWKSVPMLDSRLVMASPQSFCRIFELRQQDIK